ncbi:MAG: nitrate/nitrite transporter NrtS [Acidimicrobiales bacterium]
MNQSSRSVPAWSTVADAAKLILRGVTFHTASRVALVVGTLLSLVNQGSVIAAGNANAVTGARVAVNYLVPFTVASIGYLSPFRQRRAEPSDE